MAGIKVRLKRIAVARKAEAAAGDWDRHVARLRSARTERPQQRLKMTPEEFAAWSDRVRASARGTSQAKLVERLIAGRRRVREDSK
jgi:hypothetical protein